MNEVRHLRKLAAEKKLVTQMGTQIHAGENYRRVVEIVQAGLLGAGETRARLERQQAGGREEADRQKPSREVRHRPVARPGTTEFFEAAMNKSSWNFAWPHFHWRWWWEFGGGTLADLGCHYIDLPFWALGLTAPTKRHATGKKTYAGDNTMPDVMQVDYQFPATGTNPAVHLTWYHGVSGPDLDGKDDLQGVRFGVLFDGEKGKLVADYSKHKVLPDEFAKDFKRAGEDHPASIGHHKEWSEAIKNGGNDDVQLRLLRPAHGGRAARQRGLPHRQGD